MHLQDHKQLALVPPGQINDLEQLSLGPPGDVQDLWHAFWDVQTIAIGNYSDRAYLWLRGLGFTGSVEDMWKAYWEGAAAATEEVTNGTFDTDATGWISVQGGALASVGGELQVSNPVTNFGAASQEIAGLVNGATYSYAATGRKTVGVNNAIIRFGTTASGFDLAGSFFGISEFTVTGQFVLNPGTSVFILLGMDSNGIGDTSLFDNVSIKQVSA